MQAATAPVCILTGGPGCGKTTTTKYIVDLWKGLGKKLALCAPHCRAIQCACKRVTDTWHTQTDTQHRPSAKMVQAEMHVTFIQVF